MREHEMRERIDRLIRKTAVPAGVGITMALAGCSSTMLYEGLVPPADAQGGSQGAVPDYMALLPDAAARDANTADAPGDAQAVDESPVGYPDYAAPMPLYMAMMPDAGAPDGGTPEAGPTDASTDAG